MIAEQESDTATPASSSVEVWIPCRRRARPTISAVAPSAPAKLARPTSEKPEELAPLEAQGDHRAERRAARHPQRVGLGQRIAEERLEAEAGDRERRAAEQRQQDPRQADLPEDRRRRWDRRCRISRQRDRLAPDQRRQDQRRDPDRQQDQESGPRLSRAEVQDGHRPLAAADDLEAGAEEAVEHLRAGGSRPARRWRGPCRAASASSRSPSSEARLRSWVARTTVRSVLGLQPEQQAGEVALVARVEVERRLVEHQQLGLLGQGGGDEHGLPLAARELVDRPPAQLLDPHHPQRLVDRREVLPSRRELEGREVRDSARGARSPRPSAAPGRGGSAARRRCGGRSRGGRAGRRSGRRRRSRRADGRQQSGEAAQERRLARAVGAHHGQALAADHLQVERSEDRPRSRPPFEPAGAEQDVRGQPGFLARLARASASRIAR